MCTCMVNIDDKSSVINLHLQSTQILLDCDLRKAAGLRSNVKRIPSKTSKPEGSLARCVV